MRANTAAGWLETPWRPLTVTPQPLAAPILVSPVASSATNDNTPEFQWNLVAGAAKYELWLDNGTAFTSREFEGIFDDPQSTHTLADSLPEGRYYWKMRTINNLDVPGPWSAYRSVVIDTIPLMKPRLNSPANLAIVRGTPSFTWYAVAGGGYYQFQITASTDPGFLSPVHVSPNTLNTTSYKPPLLDPGTFLWQVQVRDAAGNWSGWSAARTVTIRPSIPPAPVLISPTGGFVTSDSTPDFSWYSVPYGNIYQIQISQSSAFTATVQDRLLGEGITTYTADLLPPGLYYWRVRAKNIENENGAWGIVRRFSITS